MFTSPDRSIHGMSPQQEAVALWKFFEDRNIKPKVAVIIRILRSEYRLKFRDGDVSKWLSKFTGRGRAESKSAHKHENPRPARTGHATRATKVSLVSTSSSGTNVPSEPPMLFSTNGHAAANGKPRREKPPPAEWVSPLLSTVAALHSRKLETLDADERLAVARAFAYYVGNCTSDERNNRTKGAHAAQGLASICYIADFGGWTVEMWLGCSRKAKRLRGGGPTLDPWLFKAALAAPERQAI